MTMKMVAAAVDTVVKIDLIPLLTSVVKHVLFVCLFVLLLLLFFFFKIALCIHQSVSL